MKVNIAPKMQTKEDRPLILTLRLDTDSQEFFNAQRKRYFPPERNCLEAHLTLFHHLPDSEEVSDYLRTLNVKAFDLQVTGLINLGAGVAYRFESAELIDLRRLIASRFDAFLTLQDQQGFRPHLTIMNKSTPELARALLTELSAGFQQFSVLATGLDLWAYLGGPWHHETTYHFD